MMINDVAPYLFAGLVGIAASALALAKAIGRIRESEQTVSKSAHRRQIQVDRIKRVARTTFSLTRDLRESKIRKSNAERTLVDLEERYKAANAIDRRVFVLDDRRTPADESWLFRIANADYTQRVNPNLEKSAVYSWRKGRRYLVWALDERKAREKVNARYPEHKGFSIVSIERHHE